MKKKLLVLSILFSLFSILSVKGNIYTVTSTVNGTTSDGVSLRWAITQANANPGVDTIKFNITGRAPHTITITSTLPYITGANGNGTVIDGSSQPANGFSGVSPKIIIDGGGTTNTALYFNASNCSVFGLVVTHLNGAGVEFVSAPNFVFGAPNKGNVINNVANFGVGLSITGCVGGTIQGNKIGTDTTGTISSSVYTGISMDASTHDIMVGGGGAGQGNLISGQTGPNSCNIIMQASRITIQGNIIGPAINLNRLKGSNVSDGIYLLGADSCIIGGAVAGQGNIIAYNIDTTSTIGAGIQNQGTHADLISRNSIYCNGNWGGLESIAGNNSYPIPVITSAYTNVINGTAPSKAIVEVFYNQSGCTTIIYGCSGETYLGTAYADVAGNWNLAGTFTGGLDVTATATDSVHNTSAFANCTQVSVTTNINELSYNNKFNIYPNPVSSFTNLEVNDNLLLQGCEFRLYDVFGREAMKMTVSQNTTIINRNKLANGVYFYQIISNGSIAGSGKLVVE